MHLKLYIEIKILQKLLLHNISVVVMCNNFSTTTKLAIESGQQTQSPDWI